MLTLKQAKKLAGEIFIAEKNVIRCAIEYTRTNDNMNLLDSVYKLTKLKEKQEIDRDEFARGFNK